MKVLVIITLAILSAACTTVVERSDHTWDVPRQVAVTAWGNDQSAMFIDNCSKKVNQVSWSNPLALSEFPVKHCNAVTKYKFANSPGKAATVIGAGMMAAGIGTGLALSGSTMAATGGAASSSSTSSASAIIKGKGHH